VPTKELLTSSYDFSLPENLIATYPANPRASAKLLVYNRKTNTVTHTIFRNILEFVPQETAFIYNNTKVIKARLFGKKSTGGKIELLLNKPLDAFNVSVYIRGKVKVGTTIEFQNNLVAKVVSLKEDGSRIVSFFHADKPLRFEELLPIIDTIGHIPLPPYIQREDEKLDEKEYQSVFAKKEGAIAAPTASLHFTPELFQAVLNTHKTAELTLHVGSGTFKPVEEEIITNHPMHSEYYEIPDDAKALLDSDTPILAVGTTSTRTIEYYARTHKTQGEANLFLHPQNPPIRVGHLLTNFHLPKSTLIMLVASFVGLEKTLELYQEAIAKEYRFYSYGDAMLIV
jgi:S-adenosylmethionine:tRNA ribosyltransferase-isomerase